MKSNAINLTIFCVAVAAFMILGALVFNTEVPAFQ